MTEDPIEPLFSHDEPGPRFKAKDIAKAIADGGIPYPTAAARVANYAKAGQIHVREKAGSAAANSPNLYAFADMCAAVMLSNIQDCGIADQELLTLASTSLYFSTVGQNFVPDIGITHRVHQAAIDTFSGEPWLLQLDVFRSDNADFRKTNRAFYRLDSRPFWSDAKLHESVEWEIVGSILINTGSLARLQRYVSLPKGAN